MEFPKEITDKALEQDLIPGKVIRTSVQHPDGATSTKRIIILTSDNKKTILGVVGTSKIEKALRYKKDYIFVKNGNEIVFDVDTVIDLDRVYEIDTISLKKLFFERKLNIIGIVSSSLFDRIINIIKRSEVIEQKYINRICGDCLCDNQRIN